MSSAAPAAHLFRPAIRFDAFAAGPANGLKRADRERLMAISTPFHVARDVPIFKRGAAADAVFNIAFGTARVYREVPNGRRILAFLFAGDLCGLAKHGTYVNTVEALTPVNAFRIPLESLTAMLRRDADLQFCFLCKAAQAVREMQRQAIVTAHRHPIDRVVAFLSMLDDAQQDEEAIHVPMRSRDIAEYADLSVDEVRRALDELRREGVIERAADRTVRITNRRRFNRRLSGM